MERKEKNLKQKVSSVRIRTWTLSIDIIISLVLFFLVNVSFKQRIDYIEFAFVSALQIITYCVYFPDGELFGQRSSGFIANRTAYNEKATDINVGGKIGLLRRFCDHDFNSRKYSHLITELGSIGFTVAEFKSLMSYTKWDIRRMKKFSYKGKTRAVSGEQKRVLINLLFKKSPVKPNTAGIVMNAAESGASGKIVDTSIGYKAGAFTKKMFRVVVIGGFLAYIAYNAKDGIEFEDIVKIVIYFTSVFASAVLAFSAGETSQKVHKCHFYLELSNFIDSFNEWIKVNNIDTTDATEMKLRQQEEGDDEVAVIEKYFEKKRNKRNEKKAELQEVLAVENK